MAFRESNEICSRAAVSRLQISLQGAEFCTVTLSTCTGLSMGMVILAAAHLLLAIGQTGPELPCVVCKTFAQAGQALLQAGDILVLAVKYET
jgi:hypothetical protein